MPEPIEHTENPEHPEHPELPGLVDLLEREGVRRLPDVFAFPRIEHRRQWAHYPATRVVGWRQTTQTFYFRALDVPFDVVPLRPNDPLRKGSWCSIGPALGADGTVQRDVLLMQTEGPRQWAAERAARLRGLLVPWYGAEPRVSEEAAGTANARHCLAVPVHGHITLPVAS
ncbi:hypothetical protein ACIO3R_31460 [Streptomyces sp. NPDC087428]|uniref:hypothetical protein n=1 Tax=Streptomyces sp. NPDC087428 TaxID=3365788 RepID=UPI00380A8970